MNKRAAHNVYRFFHMRKDEKQLVLQGMDVEKEGLGCGKGEEQ